MTASNQNPSVFSCVKDEWLSGLLRRPALRMSADPRGTSDWRGALHGEVFATAKIEAGQTGAVHALQEGGFRVVDTTLTFEAASIADEASANAIRPATAADRDRVATIAAEGFKFSRFHADPAFPKALADGLKRAWAVNFFAGKRGDGMLVAERDGVVAGFLLLARQRDALAIDLIAVAPQFARRGLARAMIAYAGIHGTGDDKKPALLRVGTQAANTPSVRLYETMGFRLSKAEFVLHHHGSGGRYPVEIAP